MANKKTSQKNPQTKTTKTTEITEHVPNIDFEEQEENLPASFHDAAIEWVGIIGHDEENFNVVLYQYDGSTGKSKSMSGQWVDEIPTQHEIGLMMGAGRFKLYITFPKSDSRPKNIVKSYLFKTHERYNELKREHDMKQSGHSPQGQDGYAQANNMDSAFAMFQKVFAMILPLVEIGKSRESPPMQDMLVDNYKTLNDVMKSNFLDQQKMYVDLMRDRADLGTETEVIEDPGDTGMSLLIKTILPVIESLFPKLQGNSKGAIDMQNQLKENPQFKLLLKNRKDLHKVITHLDKAYGKKEVGKMLKTLEVSRDK